MQALNFAFTRADGKISNLFGALYPQTSEYHRQYLLDAHPAAID
jgi:hypothetical protein